MKLSIKNFGPIKKGEIDLDKRFYVFTGYNNSGKTYLSQFLDALISYSIPHNSIIFTNTRIQNITQLPYIYNIDDNILNYAVKSFLNSFKRYLIDYLNINVSHSIIDKISIEIKGEPQNLFREAEFYYIISNPEFYLLKKEKGKNFFELSKDYEGIQLNNILSSVSVEDILVTFSEQFNKKMGSYDIWFSLGSGNLEFQVESAIEKGVSFCLFNTFIANNFFLPANRIFYPSFYKYIYSVAKEEKDKIDQIVKNGGDIEQIRSLSKRPYTKAIDNIIENIYKLNESTKTYNYYADLLLELQELMGGEVVTESSNGVAPIEFSLELDGKEKLEMYLASSASNQLTTLYLYFKYWAKYSHNFLIIDEPEENLHPKSQIALLNILMKFANRNNNRVLITTHSPFLTDVVNNHIHISYLREQGEDVNEIIKSHNLDIYDSNNLKSNDFAVYFFDGHSIKNYPINEYGVYFKNFREEEDKVRDTANILKDYIYNLSHKPA